MALTLVPDSKEFFTAAEFFAGVGLARMGLAKVGVNVTWANDIEKFKYEMYRQQFESDADTHEFVLGDIREVSGKDLPIVDLAWSSFPCTDLSLAGNRVGLIGRQSSTFYQFTRVLEEMEDDRPSVIALENVTALASSHGGEDLAAAVRELNRLDYSVDVISIDARRFVPQSRPRLFLIGAIDPPEDVVEPNSELRPDWLQTIYGDPLLRTHRAELPSLPPPLNSGLSGYLETVPSDDARWWNEDRTSKFVESLSPAQAARLDILRNGSSPTHRTAYRRTRKGIAVWEIRADDISGCLRTARGGSSKQAVVQAGNGSVQVRWMTPREYANLMGAREYNLSGLRDQQILFGFGDAVCVDAVEWLGENYLVPLLNRGRTDLTKAKGA
ncbi:DNA cytosine methyltransferase [Dietzia massiliensis]|uniref:DNA cytosine methyltransferase n=1 Tax=Dietzia massiliensis TaxID=2697499 RepID=UPI001BD1185E|nr:DNA (cytosine-5-)-methyltransferase [Dietzia massiliensis]MBS7546792.1 DNA (cytosine-5-)-methyltransferase [Dietzia massiliensis]